MNARIMFKMLLFSLLIPSLIGIIPSGFFAMTFCELLAWNNGGKKGICIRQGRNQSPRVRSAGWVFPMIQTEEQEQKRHVLTFDLHVQWTGMPRRFRGE